MTLRGIFYSTLIVAALASNNGVVAATQELVRDELSTNTASAVSYSASVQLTQEGGKRFLRGDKSVEDTLDDSVEDISDDGTPEERSQTLDFRSLKNQLNKGREENLSAYSKKANKVASTSPQDALFAKLKGMDVDQAVRIGKIKQHQIEAYKAFTGQH
ncbi:unnamed protein product [Phytophthora fragariaefolia]|uniref:Unnamed protein product n=1 Tax=Phytophthora fragariaefolia TaxID=1490495 RepID=A0A9W6XMA8_9STRA|nr:unnamed protein product [Phytophthora fragariaefolia]